ncbi:MAG TPA: threonine synthase [Acidimicrobiia bacterium]|nr:threonine synthase [Acidimicrobiia bacterium]
MRYLSTRGHPGRPGFEEVLIEGLAPDGGLFLPETWPRIDLSGPRTYPDLVAATMAPFIVPDPVGGDLSSITESAYSNFRHPEIAPLREVGDNHYLLELFWGPTLSFKDYALSVIGRMFDLVLPRTRRRLLVLGATSGDTGSAAIAACRGRENIDVVILYPAGRVSEVQRRQMTTVKDANVHAIAVEGTFDDCQALVKRAFADPNHGLSLGAFNSINWARVVAQSAYYLWAAGKAGGDRVAFAVPTGNFGNVYSGWVAKRITSHGAGSPIGRLLIANNANNGLARLFNDGILAVEGVVPTHAPAMDIQIPSNLERYLYELSGHDPERVGEWQEALIREGRLGLSDDLRQRAGADFASGWVDDETVVQTIRNVYRDHSLVIDPHTAVGWEVGRRLRQPGETLVTLAPAHPAKFGDVVRSAIGFDPPLPDELADLTEREERIVQLPNDYETLLEFLATV